MTHNTKSLSYDTSIKIFWALASICIILSGLYMYAVSTTAMNTASRKSLEENSAILSTKISEMEFQYISLKNSVSIEVAYAHGFKEVTAPLYISRSSSLNSLSINR